MVIGFPNINNNGRLGNQLYCIAATIGIAKSHGMDYGFPKWKYQQYFTKELPLYEGEYKLQWREKIFEYHEPFINTSFNTSLHGELFSFRSYKYWIEHKDEVLSYFQFNNKIMVESAIRMSKYDNPIAIHVRRGDYLNLPLHHPVLPMGYYQRAIMQFTDRKFIVFSDDIEWCKKHFHGDNFSFSEGLNEIEDLCLMSQCSGVICANSSYSEWAALIGGIENVIVPNTQFGIANNHNTNDMHLPTWKKL